MTALPCQEDVGTRPTNPLPSWREEFWRLAPQVERALEHTGGTHTIEDIADAISEGRLQLWPGIASVIITELVKTPRTTELNFFVAAGNLDEIRHLYPTVVQWGKTQGCSRATFIGRKGWERTFVTRDEGWTSRLAVYELEMDHGKVTKRRNHPAD